MPTCLASLAQVAARVYVVDSGSTDGTAELAAARGAVVVRRPWLGHAAQLNWALEALDIATPWCMKLDADERLDEELRAHLLPILASAPPAVTAFVVKLGVIFGGRRIRFGGYRRTWLLRVWRTGEGRVEDLEMDEHLLVARGETRRLPVASSTRTGRVSPSGSTSTTVIRTPKRGYAPLVARALRRPGCAARRG